MTAGTAWPASSTRRRLRPSERLFPPARSGLAVVPGGRPVRGCGPMHEVGCANAQTHTSARALVGAWLGGGGRCGTKKQHYVRDER